MNKAISIYFALFFFLLNLNLFAQDKIKIAILNFKDTSTSSEFSRFVEGLPDMLMTDLAKSEKIILVERSQIRKAIKNLNIEETKYFDQSTTIKIGKWLGADAIILGNFSNIGQNIRIDARIISIKTGSLISAVKILGDNKEIFKLIEQLSNKILINFTGESVLSESQLKILINKTFFIDIPSGDGIAQDSTKEKVICKYSNPNNEKIHFNIIWNASGGCDINLSSRESYYGTVNFYFEDIYRMKRKRIDFVYPEYKINEIKIITLNGYRVYFKVLSINTRLKWQSIVSGGNWQTVFNNLRVQIKVELN